MASSSALPKAKAKAKVRARRTAKYDHLPKDLRGAAKFLDEKNLIANINKAMNRDGRVEVPLPRGDDPAHVGRVLGDIVRRIDRSAGRSRAMSSIPERARSPISVRSARSSERSISIDSDAFWRRHMNQPPVRQVQHGGSSASTDPLGLFTDMPRERSLRRGNPEDHPTGSLRVSGMGPRASNPERIP
jgi:hypothetical protein